MDRLIQINNTLFIDLNNNNQQIDGTEDFNIFDINEDKYILNNDGNNIEIQYRLEIKRCVDIFVNLLKDQNVQYDNYKKMMDSNINVIKMIQAINNCGLKTEEFYSTRLMMIIYLKNYLSEFINTYIKNIVSTYEKHKYKKEINNFNNLIYTKNDKMVDKEDNHFYSNEQHGIHKNGENKNNMMVPQCIQNNFAFISFLRKGIFDSYSILENIEDKSKSITIEEWIYLKEKIMTLIKNSCVINTNLCNNIKERCCSNFLDEINKNMYKSYKKYNSIIEMKNFNECLYFIDIFFNIFLVDYPYKWDNLLEDLFNNFNFISIIKMDDCSNILNKDYNGTINYIMKFINNMDISNSDLQYIPNEENCNKYKMVIDYSKFYMLMLLINKILKKYIPPTDELNSYSNIYYTYFSSNINNNNNNLLEKEDDYYMLNIPCENLLVGYKDIIKIYFPFFNRLLYYLLHQVRNVYIIFIIEMIVKCMYKLLLCDLCILSEEVINEHELLFTNIMKILEINLSEYVNKIYFMNKEEALNGESISVSKMFEEGSYENINELMNNNEENNIDKLYLKILLKSKKWCLKILNMFLYRSIHFDDMNDTWKIFLKHFEDKYIIFLEKITLLILKIMMNTIYSDDERNNTNILYSYIKYVINYTDYMKYADKCLSLALNYVSMIISLDHLKMFIYQNVLSDIFLNCLFIHIDNITHIECIDNFQVHQARTKEEKKLHDNLKFEEYIICFKKHTIFRNYLLSCYDDSSSKSILKKYMNYIIYLFCELLCKYFYDIIYYLDEKIKENLKVYLLYQNVYMNLLYPEMYIKKDINFLNDDKISIKTYKKSSLFFNAEININTGNHYIYINNIIDYISEIIRNHMKENKIDYNFDFSNFYLLNNDTFNSMIYIIKNLPLYKYSEDDLIFKGLYSINNEYNLNYSFIIMNDINLYKYFSLYMFLIYYKYEFVKAKLKNIISEKNEECVLSMEYVSGGDNRDTYNKENKKDNNEYKYYSDDKNSSTPYKSNYLLDNNFGRDKENNISIEDLMEEYFRHRERYKDSFCKDNNEIEKFDHIVDNLKNKDKDFFLQHMLINLLHPYSDNLKRKVMWMIKEYMQILTFDDNVIRFFFYGCFINLFYFEKHIKLKSFETLINLMYMFGIPSKVLYNDFREVLIFLFFQLLILFIKKESECVDSLLYEENRGVLLFYNNEKMDLLRLLKGNLVKELKDKFRGNNDDNNIINCYICSHSLECLYTSYNCFSDNFMNDVIYKNFYFYLEKIEENNMNEFLKFISLFYQNEINNKIFLFINLLNESLLDMVYIKIQGKDEEYNFLRILKFFSFFLEHYKNTCSTQDVLIVKILQNENFIIYFKSIILNILENLKKKNKGTLVEKEKHRYILNEEILNEIYYILYIFTKKSLFNYKIFWFYFNYGVACIYKDLKFFSIEEDMINVEEKLYNTPIYIFQFFNNLIRRDIINVFFSLGVEEPFECNDVLPISLIEILRKISLLYLCVSDENMNDQTFYYNSIVGINGLYLYNNILSYLIMLLIRNNIFFTYPLWFELNRSYEIIHNGTVLSDMDDCISNCSFKKYDHFLGVNDIGSKMSSLKNDVCITSKQFGLDENILNENILDENILHENILDKNILNENILYGLPKNEEYDEKSILGGTMKKLKDIQYVNNMEEIKNVEYTFSNGCEDILFYKEMKNYFRERKKDEKDTKDEKRNNRIGFCAHINESTFDNDGDIYDNRNNNIKDNMYNNNKDGNINNKHIVSLDNGKDRKISELMNTLYFNIFLLKDKKEEHIRKLLKSLKYINDNFFFYNCQNEYEIYMINLMIQKKRYIYQSFSMYIYLDIQDFFDILVKGNIFDKVIDDWINDIFYIYQNSDDLKYFIFSLSNMLIYLCLYEKVKKMRDLKNDKYDVNKMNDNICVGEGKNYVEMEKEMEYEYLFPFFFFFLKNKRNTTNGINSINSINSNCINNDSKLFEEILKKDMIRIDSINEYATNKLNEKITKIINALINIVLILPIPYEEDMKVFNKNLLRRLAPICGERENIKDNTLLKLNSTNSNIINGTKSCLDNIQFDDLIQNILFMHLNNYEQKFYERNDKEEQHMNKSYHYNVVHINKFDELKLNGKKVSIHYYFQNNSNQEFIDSLISDCNCNYFKISFYVKKAFSLLTQKGFSNDDLINMIGCSDKYYNFINIISMDI
ncbi:conserved Plasmodium protein, unknown function [Plasmodium sp. DRC-Itaito]|nr:conserved Plasmodium protein, unknown function [Plasmodium sp. DRC-Itaito]